MMFVLTFVLFLSVSKGFLLEKNSTGGSTLTVQHYLHLLGLVTQEKENSQQMEQLVLKLNTEMKALQIACLNNGNGSTQQLMDLKNEYAALQKDFIQLTQEINQVKNDNVALAIQLKQEINQVKNDIVALAKKNERLQIECSNSTLKLKTELETFTHSISAGNLKNMTQIQSSVESLENKMDKTTTKLNSLISSSNARSQDFLALLNQTRDAHRKVTSLDKETKLYQNTTNQKFVTMETHFHGYETSTKKKINNAFQKITSINQTVFMTFCAHGRTVSGGSVVKFTNPRAIYGVSDVNALKRSGKFTCEVGGVYLFSVFIMSQSNPSEYQMYKNNDLISYVYVVHGTNNGNNYDTGTGIVAVSLNVGDTLYVKAHFDMDVQGGRSCMTVIKIR